MCVRKCVISCLLLLSMLSFASAQTGKAWKSIETIAGNGKPPRSAFSETALSNPFGVEPTLDGNLLVASYDHHVLLQLDMASRKLKRIAGLGKPGDVTDKAMPALIVPLKFPHEVRVDAKGRIFVADTSNHRVGMIDPSTGIWKTIAGTGGPGFSGDGGPANAAEMNEAYSIAVRGNELFIADLQNQRIRSVSLDNFQIETIAGNGRKSKPVDGELAEKQPLEGPRSLAVDDDNLWIVLREGNSVWRIDRASGKIFHVAGSGEKGFSGDGGQAKLAQLNGPKGIAVDPGRFIYIADTENHAIRQVNLTTGVIDTVVGSPKGERGFNGDGDHLTQRLLSRPHGVCLMNGDLIIGDSENHRVRKVSE